MCSSTRVPVELVELDGGEAEAAEGVLERGKDAAAAEPPWQRGELGGHHHVHLALLLPLPDETAYMLP